MVERMLSVALAQAAELPGTVPEAAVCGLLSGMDELQETCYEKASATMLSAEQD